MPIYEYECAKCGHRTEVWQKFSDLPVSECEVCKGRMRKLVSHSSFHLKGTGWYVTDYASKSLHNPSHVSGGSEKKASGASSEGSGGKPEQKKTTSKSSDS